MNRPHVAIATFKDYIETASKYVDLPDHFNMLELGPGDSVLSGVVAKSFGANNSWLIDSGFHVDTNINLFAQTCELLPHYIPPRDIHETIRFDKMLELFNISYFTSGLDSLRQLDNQTVDFCWSQVVLEHVPRDQFFDILCETRRIIKSTGVCVHSVDFKDHISSSLNNLRFSSKTWESKFFKSSGFYTNRIRPSQAISLMKEAGFNVHVVFCNKWDSIPLPLSCINEEFRHLPEDDFLISEMRFVLLPSPCDYSS